MASGSAFAQRGEGGGGEGRGGGGESSARSSRGGGGGGQSSAQSSRGGSESSARSSRGGGDSSNRSFRGGQNSARSFQGGESSRSFRGSDNSSRSFSRSPSQSFSSEGRSSRESRNGESLRRSMNRSSEDGERSRSNQGPQFRGSDRSSQFRSFQGGERATIGEDSRDSFRTGRSDERSGSDLRRQFSGERSQSDQGRQGYQARRPSEDQVRDFLEMRRDDGVRQRGDDDRREVRDREERREQFGNRQFRSRERDDDRERFADDDDNSRDRDRGEFRDRDRDRDDFRRGRDRDDRGDRDYDGWRDRAWLGERGEGRDHRDWSGRWRDGDRFRTSHYIRDRWFRDRWDDHDDYPFHVGWWDRHRGGWNYWDRYAHRHNRPYYWWSGAAAPRLASWVTYGWPQHYYWDYGQGEYIYYNDGVVYVNGQWYQPGPVFYERTVELVDQAPEVSAEDAAEKEWLPLGVFAVTRDGETEPDVLVQLAVTQDGMIAGTAFEPDSSESYPIEGVVEKETQRAVWSFTGDRDQRVLMETSIFNLTQPEATGLVQYGPENIRVVQLVRLEQPEDGSGGATTASEGDLPTPERR